MATFNVHDRVMVCESHHEYGHEWINKIGHVAVVTRKTLVIYMGNCNIHVPKNKVISA